MSHNSGAFLHVLIFHFFITLVRPEKDHKAQLLSFASLLKSHPEYREAAVKLVLVGGSRNEEDAARVEGLRSLAKELEVDVSL